MKYSLLGLPISVLALTLSGCVTLDAKSSYDEASQLILERTGAAAVYNPALSADPAAERVREALQDGVTLEEAIAVALLNNPTFQAQFLEIGVSQADLVQSSLLSNPTLSFSVLVPDIEGRSGLGGGLVQSLVELWQLPIRKRIAETQLERSILRAANAAIELRADVKTKFYTLLALAEAKAQAETSLALLDHSLTLAQRQFETGDTGIQDVNLARAAYLDGHNVVNELTRDRAQATAQFFTLLGVVRVASGTEIVGELPEPLLLPLDKTELLLLAARHRLDAQAAVLNVRIAEQDVTRELWSRVPSVSLGLEAERTEEASQAPTFESSEGPKEKAIYALAGPSIEVVLPLWDQNQAQVRKMEIVALQRRKELESLLDAIESELAEAVAAFDAAKSSVTLLKNELIPLATKNVEVARTLYEAGEESVYPLLYAQQALVDRERAYGKARADFGAAYAELERAAGGNLEELATINPADAEAKVKE